MKRTHYVYRHLALLLLVALNLTPISNVRARSNATDVTIYSEALVAPWEDYSYDTTVDFANNTAYQGTEGIAITHTAAYGAFSVYTPSALTASDYLSVAFWAYGAAGGSPITVSLGDSPTTFYEITIPAGVWTYYAVLLTDLGSPATVERINWQDNSGAAQATYYLDEIEVLATPATIGFPDATSDGARTLEPGPSGVAVAPNGRVYAVVYKDDRVYSWATVASMLNGTAPDKTFGSANGDPDGVGGCTSGPSATLMCGPESIAVDGNGNLFVADTYNHRILVFLNPDTDATPLQADSVLGQLDLSIGIADYDSNNADGVMEGFCYVRGLAVDSANRLWAVDEFNYRVIRFDTPLTLGTLPSKVFGQAALDTNPAGCVEGASGNSGANKFGLPLGVAVDAQDTLYVTDISNNRVQRFASGAANGANATATYGGLDTPHDVAVDKQGNVYIADTLNSQVLVFAGGPNGDLASDHAFPGRNFPMGMTFTAKGDFLVADCGSPLANTDYPPCLSGPRGVYFFAAPNAPQYDPPNAVDDTASTVKNSPASGNVLTNDSDPQASSLTVASYTQPASGAVTVLVNGLFTYTPTTDFVGATSFNYVVSNSYNLTDTATVSINVTQGATPQPPLAVNDTAQTLVNTPLKGNVLTNDSDPKAGALTVIGFSQPGHGVATVAVNGSYAYTPTTNFLGDDAFTYIIENSANLTATATVSLKVVDVPVSTRGLFLPSLAR